MLMLFGRSNVNVTRTEQC